MKRFISTIIIGLFVIACQQQSPLQVEKSQVFHTSFPDSALLLDNDDGRGIRLARPSSSQGQAGVRGAFDPFAVPNYNQNNYNDPYSNNSSYCDPIYGCQQNPYSQWIGYSNYVHSWNPSFTRIVNMRFGIRGNHIWYGTDDQEIPENFIPYDEESCWKLEIRSNRKLHVLRFIPGNGYGYNNSHANSCYPDEINGDYNCIEPVYPSYVEGSGTKEIKMNSNQVRKRGKLVFAVEDQMADDCMWQPYPWWDYNQYQPVNCGGQYSKIHIGITGKGGRCGAEVEVGVRLTPYVNSYDDYYNQSYYSQSQYYMPRFHFPLDNGYAISGRVMEYGNQYDSHQWQWGGYFPEQCYGYNCLQPTQPECGMYGCAQ